MNRLSWEKYFLLQCRMIASRSTCLSRKVGALIVKENRIISTGYNGNISGFNHCDTYIRCYKRNLGYKAHSFDYCRAIHAEMNALITAGKSSVDVNGAEIYCNISPCYGCFKILVNAGIRTFIFEEDYNLKEYKLNCPEFANIFYYENPNKEKFPNHDDDDILFIKLKLNKDELKEISKNFFYGKKIFK